MRSSTLTFVFAIFGPLSLGSVACFLSTEGDGYDDYETYGTDGSCEVGTEGCDCTTGGSCNPGYKCDNNQNICFLDVCPVGTEGCECTPAGACDPIPEGLLCLSEVCVLDPALQCPAGTESCPCTGGGGCDMGLTCLSETCVDPSGIETGTSGGNDSSPGTTAPPADDSSGGEDSSTGEVLDGTGSDSAGAGGSTSGSTGG